MIKYINMPNTGPLYPPKGDFTKFLMYIICMLFLLLQASCASIFFRNNGVHDQVSGSGIVSTAEKYLGVRYKRGGVTPKGFDCSGYVHYVYAQHGIDLPRSASGQYSSGTKIRLRNARPGDLIFFHTSGKWISHVGIYAGNLKFIHAPRSGKRICYTSLKNRYWKKRYVGAATYQHGRGYQVSNF